MGSQLRVWEPALGSRLNEGGSYPDLREKRKSGKDGKAEPRDMRVLGIPSQGIFGFWESQAKGYAGFGNPKPREAVLVAFGLICGTPLPTLFATGA